MGGEEGLGVTTGQPNLYKQDLSKLDVSKLTALSREVISRQATINIGTIGHVAHGKSTIVKAISGVQTVRFKNELERNITIKLDNRAMESSRGYYEDNPGHRNRIQSVCEKRSHSTEEILPPAKQLKLDQKLISNEESINAADKSPQHSNNTTASFNKEDIHQISKEQECRISLCDSKNQKYMISSKATKICDSNIGGWHTNYKLGELKLKDLRIVLEDIKYNKRVNVDSTKNSLWEVEKILGKKEQNGIPLYLIKWKNWDSKYNTWEPEVNLVNCSDILKDFEDNRLMLLEHFKQKRNFYPNHQDVEKFLNEIKLTGETVDCIPVEQDAMYSDIRRFLKLNDIRYSILEKKIKSDILRMLLCEIRKEQLESLEDWESEMNSISKGKPVIKVENFVDLERAPQNFYYIDDYLPGAGIVIPDDPPIGCECKNCSFKTTCCFTQFDGHCPYTTKGKIRIPPGTPIYECNKRCACDINCMNRVVQRGTNMKFCIFRTNNGRGWGVKTTQAIKRGTFVTEYVGEVITSEEADRRGKEYDAIGRTYLFDLDYNETGGQCPYTVDAAMYGNISHFINHSCEPNLAVYGIWINCLDPNLPKLALFALRDIKQNEEITFDYLCQSLKNSDNYVKTNMTLEDLEMSDSTTLEQTLEIRPETPESDTSINKMLCKCGARTCRQFLF